jgi:hypothetical protein
LNFGVFKLHLAKVNISLRLFQYLGFLLLMVAFLAWFLVMFEIQSSHAILSEAQNLNLAIEQIWAVEGALEWWKNVYVTVIIPLIGILITSGIIALLSPLILRFEHRVLFRKVRNKHEIITLDRFLKSRDNV